MRNLRILGLGMVLVLGLFVVSCGENAQDDSGANPAISQEDDSGFASTASDQTVQIPEVNTFITSKPPKSECGLISKFTFNCDRERTCKQLQLQLQAKLPAFLRPFCACAYECKLDLVYPTPGLIAAGDPEGWYNCSSPEEINLSKIPSVSTFWVRATDYCGNVDPSPAKYSWDHCYFQ